jgi:hypothetical protein
MQRHLSGQRALLFERGILNLNANHRPDLADLIGVEEQQMAGIAPPRLQVWRGDQ